MKVSVSPAPSGVIDAKQMNVGQVAEVVGLVSHGQLILRTYNRFVSLNTPENTWLVEECNVKVRVLPVGTKVTLTLEV